MERMKVMEAVIEKYRAVGPKDQEGFVWETLKRMSDMNLLAFAFEIGIDASQEVRP